MSSNKVFIQRILGASVFDPAGERVGKVRDAIMIERHNEAPLVSGLIIDVARLRRVFIPISRITSFQPGAVFTTGLINLQRFQQRSDEMLIVGELLGRRVSLVDGTENATVEDAAIDRKTTGEWRLVEVYVRKPKTTISLFGKGEGKLVRWSEIRNDGETATTSHDSSQLIASFRELKAADLADALLDLPEPRRYEVADELDPERLADAFEELGDEDRVTFLNHTNDDRAADVLDHMEPDDATDTIGELPAERQEAILALMRPEEAEDVRMLMKFAPDTAGGLMTTQPVICSADATAAEALALLRRPSIAVPLATIVCVTLPPFESPTGRFIGVVHIQKLLRNPPHVRLGTLIDTSLDPLLTSDSIATVARVLATYDLVSSPVVDENRRLVGVVTVDDVLDNLLPDDWRTADDDDLIQVAARSAYEPHGGGPNGKAH